MSRKDNHKKYTVYAMNVIEMAPIIKSSQEVYYRRVTSSYPCQKLPAFYAQTDAENLFLMVCNFSGNSVVFQNSKVVFRILENCWKSFIFCHFLRIQNDSFAEIPPSLESVMYIYIYKYTLRILVLGNIDRTVTSPPHPVFDSLLNDSFSARHTPLPPCSEKNSLCTVITGDGRESKNHDGEGDRKPLSDTFYLAIELTLDGWNAVEQTRLDTAP